MQTFQVRPANEPQRQADETEFTVATKLKGPEAEKFKKLAEENGLSYSALVRQMIDHCMNSISGPRVRRRTT